MAWQSKHVWVYAWNAFSEWDPRMGSLANAFKKLKTVLFREAFKTDNVRYDLNLRAKVNFDITIEFFI